MDEFQFQFEQNPELKEQAVAAVNRTLWLEHWEMARYKVRSAALGAIPAASLLVFRYLDKKTSGSNRSVPDGFHVNDILPLFILICLAVWWFAKFVPLASKIQRYGQVKSPVEYPKRITWIAAWLALVAGILLVSGTFSQRIFVCLFSLILASSAMTWF